MIKDPIKRAAYERKRRDRLKSEHKCVHCTKQDERTLRGLTLCAACYARDKAYNIKEGKITYYWRKENHYCVVCGKKDAFTINGRSACAACAEKDAARQRRKSGYKPREKTRQEQEPRIPAAERPAYGLCYFCGAPLAARLNSAGEKTHTCERCYQRCRKNALNAKVGWYAKKQERIKAELAVMEERMNGTNDIS